MENRTPICEAWKACDTTRVPECEYLVQIHGFEPRLPLRAEDLQSPAVANATQPANFSVGILHQEHPHCGLYYDGLACSGGR